MDAGKRTINDIFNGNRILEIPFFQRAYVWGNDQWERLLEDMENVSLSNKPYFLGSVILKQQPTNTGNQVVSFPESSPIKKSEFVQVFLL